jgi:hypothetical protein
VGFADDPVISDVEAMTTFKSGHFLRADAPGIFGEFIEGVVQPPLKFRVLDFPQHFF